MIHIRVALCPTAFVINKYAQRLYFSCNFCTRALEKRKSADNFTKIYDFPYIRVAGIVNRLKIYQTVLTVIGIPSTVLLQWMDIVPFGVHEPVIGLGLSGTIVLYSVGLAFHRLVGAVYLSSDESIVKISYLDYWGRRLDTTCPLNDVLPISDLADGPSDPYINLLRYSTRTKLRLSIRYGKVVDDVRFRKVFGDFKI